MNGKTKGQIYQYLQKYLNQKQEHSDYIDYYELCNLNEGMSIEQLQKEMKQKKLVKLFHPDQESYLDPEFQGAFRECSSKIEDMKNIFSDQSLKARYDKELQEKKSNNEELKRHYEEELERQQTSRERNTNDYKRQNDMLITTEERKHVERAVETTIYKFGFYHGYIALQKALRGDFSMVTNENHGRDLLKQVGVQKIRKIIEAAADIMESNPNNMVMDYYCKVINKSGLQEKAEVFYNACFQTSLKYDLGNDVHQTEGAISRYIETLDMNAFTSQNVDKLEFAKLSPQDVKMLICAKMHSLGKTNPDYLFTNFAQNNSVQQVKLFASEIQKEARKAADQRKAM